MEIGLHREKVTGWQQATGSSLKHENTISRPKQGTFSPWFIEISH